ncbi:phage tail tape measure protein [Sinomonas sp. JGH33]|uniref:Phage tail tape measure protein n=1 Tax=Sinomonas terricola TaxID=3110330 RepID=A0ABU5T146_9MICC|nr:phage tail tape measure protein [Sinomonas sp. JGH33]MEA5453305.1 phage tail tape measure protein [Sinomonas sp. JGH33]
MASTSLVFDIFAKDHNTKQTFEGIEKAGSSVGKTLGAALGPLGLGIGAGLGAVEMAKGIGEMVKAAGDFQAANTRLVTSAGESQQNLKQVGDGMLKVAQDTGTTIDNLEKGAYYIESAGYHGADMLKVLTAAAQGAKAEGSSVETVGDAVTSTLRDYHLTADQAANVTSKLITATAQGKTTFELFSGSLHSVLPMAAAAHISLDDILGDLASMTVHGMSADQATQNLNDTIRHMINPTQQQTKEFALFGLTAQGVADELSSKGLSGTLDMLHDKIVKAMPPGSDKVLLDVKTALNELDPKVQQLGQHLFDGSMGYKEWFKAAIELDPVHEKQITQLATLLGSTHALGNEQISGEKVLQNYAQAWRLLTGDATGTNVALMLTGENADYTQGAIKAVAGAAADASGNVKGWSEIQDNFNTKLDRAKEIFETMSIKIGSKLLPVLGDALDKFTEFVTDVAPMLSGLWEKDIQPALDNISNSFLGVFGDSSGTAGTTGNAADGFGTAMDKVGTNADGTLGKDGTVAKAAKEFGDSMKQVADGIKSVTDALPKLDKAVDDTTKSVDDNGMQMHEQAVGSLAAIETAIGLLAFTWGSLAYEVGGAVGQIVGDIERLPDEAAGFVASFQTKIVGAFGDASLWLLNAGGDIVLGLERGIEGSVDLAVHAAENLAGNVLDAAKTALGIHSPSRVFHEIGQNVGLGFVGGLDSTHGLTRNAMGRFADAAMAGFGYSWPDSGPGSGEFGGGQALPSSLRLVVDGHEFHAYVDGRASRAIDNADYYAGRRPSL